MSHPHRIGQYEITTLLDGVFEAPTDALLHAGGEAARERLIEGWGAKTFRIDVNCYLLRGPNGTTLIDAGCGNEWGDAFGKARTALEQAGVTPDQIDRVLLTHIHGDHAIGLFDGTAPWLPRAEILVSEIDLAFFTDPAARETQPDSRRGGFDLAEKLVPAYAGRLRAIPPGPVPDMPGVEIVPLPGHTPGHSGFLLHNGADSLMIWADTLHLRDAQTADPDIGLIFDVDGDTARQTRRALLERLATEGWLATGMHVTGMGRIERAGDAYRFVSV